MERRRKEGRLTEREQFDEHFEEKPRILHIPWSEPTTAEDGGEEGSDEGNDEGGVLLDLGARVVSLARTKLTKPSPNMDRGSYIGEGAFPLEDQFPIADAMPTNPFPVRVKERELPSYRPVVCRVSCVVCVYVKDIHRLSLSCVVGLRSDTIRDETFPGDTFTELVYVLPRVLPRVLPCYDKRLTSM